MFNVNNKSIHRQPNAKQCRTKLAHLPQQAKTCVECDRRIVFAMDRMQKKKIVSAVLGWLWCRLAQSHHQMKGTRRKKTAASKQKPYQTGYGRKQWDANTQRFKRTRCDAVCEIEQSIEIDKGANVRTNFVMLSAGDFIQIRRLLSERRAGPLLPRDVVS